MKWNRLAPFPLPGLVLACALQFAMSPMAPVRAAVNAPGGGEAPGYGGLVKAAASTAEPVAPAGAEEAAQAESAGTPRLRWLTLQGKITPGTPIRALVTYWDSKTMVFQWNFADIVKGTFTVPIPEERMKYIPPVDQRQLTVRDSSERAGEYRLVIPIGPNKYSKETLSIMRVQLLLDWPADWRLMVDAPAELLRIGTYSFNDYPPRPDPRFGSRGMRRFKVRHGFVHNHGGPFSWERMLEREWEHFDPQTGATVDSHSTVERMYHTFPLGTEDLVYDLDIEIER